MVSVREVMSKELVTAGPETPVAEAATVMGGHHVGSVLVMEDERLIGIFTERDIVRALGQHFDAAAHPVRHWMSPEPRTCEPDDDIRKACPRCSTVGSATCPSSRARRSSAS